VPKIFVLKIINMKINITRKTILSRNKKNREINIKKSLKKQGSILKVSRLKKEYDPTNPISAKNIPLNFARKVKWICSIHKTKWSATVITRYDLYGTRKYLISGCPTCRYTKASETMKQSLLKKNGSLLDKFSELSKEWDYKKNKVSPKEITSATDVEYWWICRRHKSYLRSPAERTRNGKGCKLCGGNTLSRAEIRLYCEMKFLIPNCLWNIKIEKKQIDIFLKDYNFGFEIDGHYHKYKKRILTDKAKNKFFAEKGIKIVRLRYPLVKRKISKDDFFIDNKGIKLSHIKNCLRILKKYRKIKKIDLEKINKYLRINDFINEKEYRETLKSLPNIPTQFNLKFNYPELCEEWDYKKNKHERPEFFHKHSNESVYWLCKVKPKNQPKLARYLVEAKKYIKKHSGYKMAIWDRVDGHGCDFCGRIKTAISQCERSVKKNGSLKDYPKYFDLIKSKKIKNDIKEILHQIPAGSKSIYFDWYCKKHKHTWNTFVRRIVLDEHGCNYCGYDKMIATKKLKKHSRA